MCLEEVTRFSGKHDVASAAVKKFSRILLRSPTKRIEPVTCQNYFARAVNSARRDFFSRLDVCCHTTETRASSTDQLCIIAIKTVLLPQRSMKSTNDGAEAEDRSSIVAVEHNCSEHYRTIRSISR